MNLGEKMRRGALWLSASQVATRALEFGFGVVLSRLLAPEQFGLLVTVQIFTGIVGYLASGGMAEALVRKQHVEESDYQVVFTVQLLLCSAIYLGFFFISPWFAEWYGKPIYHDLLRVSTISFLFRPFLMVPRARLHREMNYRAAGLLQACGLGVSGASSITLALHGYEVWSLVLGSIMGTVFVVLTTSIAARWMPMLNFSFKGLREIGSYGMKTTLNDFCDYIRGQVPNFIIGMVQGPTVVGLYNKADSLSVIPMGLVSGSIYQPVFRALSQFQDNLDKSKYIYLKSLTVAAVYCLPFYVFMWWLAEPFIAIVYGPTWVPSAEPLRVLSMAGLFWVIINQSGALIAAQNRLGRELLLNVQGLLLVTAAVIWGLSHGLAGIAYGMLAVNAYYCVRMAYLANTTVHSRLIDFMRALWPPLLFNGLLMGTLWLVDFLWQQARYSNPLAYILAMAGVGGTVYLLAFLLIPFKSLAGEVARCKRLLGVSYAGVESAPSDAL